MAIYSLPVSDSAFQINRATLEGISYEYELRYNTRDEAWYMRLARSGRPYRMSTKVRVGLDLLMPFKYHEEMPNGAIIVVDKERYTGRIDRDGFGIDKRFELLYIDESDLDLFDGYYYNLNR